jgi:hypothetical protein
MYNNPSFQLFLMATLEPYRLCWEAGDDKMQGTARISLSSYHASRVCVETRTTVIRVSLRTAGRMRAQESPGAAWIVRPRRPWSLG